ncbi:hypothetical protein [Staphylococcus agnetis]|uniref:Trep_Strep domain-containing protein n=1 Tax=Staphylococcus agnetis TaxID=985762 RepID=A0ABD7TW73_9STAP|nr:hypothetical protein [Staphylococcus agnetis]MDG4942829.1 hypothetical protein [Staphylococcus agnetis]OSP20769.1 hypothetical protein B9M87_12385 [Staphylococcus agnetis]OSP22703.1 hypothetical protein B9L42_00020 [Staphylococcus agnetis]OTW29955.1 hypothetical protein B9M88_12525 [Staphylococcus agnetis]UXU57077.1 hypothetical protein MUA95_11035 [Staphylococcus agnetis]
MKTIITSVIINGLLVSFFLFYLAVYSQFNEFKILILYLFSSVLLPIVGIIFNTVLQKRINIVLSNAYVSLLSALVLILPVELFKNTSKLINAEKAFNGKAIDGNNSAITYDIDLSFNLSSYILVALFWILIGSVIGTFYKKVKKNND